jgi:hypothetical protein
MQSPDHPQTLPQKTPDLSPPYDKLRDGIYPQPIQRTRKIANLANGVIKNCCKTALGVADCGKISHQGG